MRANMLEVVTRAITDSRAVPAISIYDFTTAQSVVAASEEAGRSIILLVPPKAAQGKNGMRFIRALRQLANSSTTEVCIQLDHATDLALIRDSVDAGVDAVLADGSALSASQNAGFVTEARKIIGPDTSLEAELGAIAGDEDVSEKNDAGEKTDPREITSFLTASKADLLAVAVGNVHGSYKGAPQLDWPLIEMIRVQAATVPMVLHGASGLSAADLARAGGAGIGKVNFNTELRTTIFRYINERSSAHSSDGMNMLAFLEGWGSCVREFTSETHRRLALATESCRSSG